MQTFLPYPDFTESARCLDDRRLGKQRVEVLTLLLGGWPNHPASKMWRGFEWKLSQYGCMVCLEWSRRGYMDTVIDSILKLRSPWRADNTVLPSYPPWLGDEAFHLSHKSNLIRELPEHYRPLWPDVPDNLPYVWPVR